MADDWLVLSCDESFFLVWEGLTDKKDNLKAIPCESGTITAVANCDSHYFIGTESGEIKTFALPGFVE